MGRSILRVCLVVGALALFSVAGGAAYLFLDFHGRFKGDDEPCRASCSLELDIRDKAKGYTNSPYYELFDQSGNKILQPYSDIKTFKSLYRVDINTPGYEPQSVRLTNLGWQLRKGGHGNFYRFKYIHSARVELVAKAMSDDDIPRFISALESTNRWQSRSAMDLLEKSTIRSSALAPALKKMIFDRKSPDDHGDTKIAAKLLREIIGAEVLDTEILNQILKVTHGSEYTGTWNRHTKIYLSLLGTPTRDQDLYKKALCQLVQDPREERKSADLAAVRLGAPSREEIGGVGCPPYHGPPQAMFPNLAKQMERYRDQ